jgi:hypothetical protein
VALSAIIILACLACLGVIGLLASAHHHMDPEATACVDDEHKYELKKRWHFQYHRKGG